MTNPPEVTPDFDDFIEDEQPSKPSDPWDVWDAILFLLVYFFANIFFYSVLTSFIPNPQGLNRLYFNVSATLMANTLLVVLFILRGHVVHRFSWEDLGFRGASWRDVVYWGVLFFVLVFAFNLLYGLILQWLGLGKPNQEVAKFFSNQNPWTFKSLALLMVIVSAPLTEELMHRGVIFSATREHMPPMFAATTAGLIFGALHFEPKTIIPLGFLGFLLCYIYHQTKSLWLCIGLHAANNSIAFFWLMYFQQYFN